MEILENKITIQGSRKDGEKIIKYFQSLGGNNYYNESGKRPDFYYFIDEDSDINYTSSLEWLEKNGYLLSKNIPFINKRFEVWTY